MKKNILLSGLFLSALALMSSCKGDYDDWANPQHNDQESAVTLPGFKATAAGDVNLANPGSAVKVFTLSTAALPEGSTLEKTRIVITPSGEATSTASVTLDATNEGTVDSTALQNAVVEAYGRRPSARPFKVHAYSDVMVGGQAMYVDAGEIDLNVTPKGPHISSAYYLIGNMTDWALNTNMKFNHSDQDVYDDPVFSITFTTSSDGQYWKIIPQENVTSGDTWADGVVGVAVDGSTDASGTLVTDNPQAAKIAEAGTYTLTLNMMDYTYTIEKTPTYYMVGAVAGWNAEAAATCLFYNEEASSVSYTTKWINDGNLKIWEGTSLGDWDKCWGAVSDGDNSPSGKLVNSGAGAIVVPEKGAYYKLTLNMANKTYTWTRLDNQTPTEHTLVGLIGDFNSWGGDVEMTQVTPHNWYVETTFATTGGVKFRADGGWDVNWGGSYQTQGSMYYGTGVANGDNLSIPAGKYKVYLNDITGQFAFIAQ